MNVVEVDQIQKRYGKSIANEAISMTVKEHEIVSILGPNGAGKTTLLKQIYGELEPDKGEIRVLGKKPDNVKKKIGILPQEVRPFGYLTVYDNLYYIGRIKGVNKGILKERIDQLTETFELDKRKYARDLSGGMKRKLLLAMAMVNDPELLILDEPTVGLDPEGRRKIWDLLLDLKRSGKSILLTTHYLDEAEKLSDRIYFLNKKVLFSGTPSEIKTKFTEWYEVIDYTEGRVYRVNGDEVKKLVMSIHGKFEVKMPSLEEVYLQVFKGE
ncbi:MarR family transcriptional regulator [Sulfolobales archaeon HS-7]|nr:MarR family transcriptional regulator [Sulfolobales archaeon HS-7]